MMQAEFLKKHRVLFLHISFWIMYFTYAFYSHHDFFGFNVAVIRTALTMICLMMPCYIHYFLILPSWLQSKKWIPYTFKVTLLIAFSSWFYFTVPKTVTDKFAPVLTKYFVANPSRILDNVWDILAFMLFTGMIRFALDRFDLERKKNQLENEKLMAELNYLKAQVNPDFLFTTFDNLEQLIRSGSKEATEVIIRLSNIMRYMIYNANKGLISLSKEIEYIHNYTRLETIRLSERLKIDFTLSGSNEVEIAPFILGAFLENAFKQAVATHGNYSWIKISLNATSEAVHYKLSHTKSGQETGKETHDTSLNDLKKRLLLSYPEKHELNITNKEDITEVNLKLYL